MAVSAELTNCIFCEQVSGAAARLGQLADDVTAHSAEAADAVRSLVADFRFDDLVLALSERKAQAEGS